MTTDPCHIAIIMDGNRRWAERRGLAIADGHKEGGLVAKNIITEAAKSKIRYLTLYAFSSENWQRSDFEVSNLMLLLEFYLSNNSRLLLENNIRFRVIGDIARLSPSIQKKITEYEILTKNSTGLNLIIALNYGSKLEIVDSCRKICLEVIAGTTKLEELNEQKFAEFLYTKDIPDPDLLIRTSGEQRISNFLLWQIAYTELYFTNKLWPDFNKEDLDEAIKSFRERKRKYGAK